MTPNAFENHALGLLVKPDSHVEKLVHAALGVGSEAGELLTPVKKHWIYGAGLDVENII